MDHTNNWFGFEKNENDDGDPVMTSTIWLTKNGMNGDNCWDLG